jgi:Mg2+-importing ATPase
MDRFAACFHDVRRQDLVLPFTWIGATLGFVPLPPLYWPAVIAIIGCYAVLTQLTKSWFVRRWGM